MSYEECRDYFAGKSDELNQLRYQQICQALETAKPEYKVDINKTAVESFKKYAEYQKAYFPRIKLLNNVKSDKVNGWWTRFSCGNKNFYILHKTDRNCVDLTIIGGADRIIELKSIERWLHESGKTHISLETTGKSAAFRIKTPGIKMSELFELWKMGNLNACFEAIQELTDLAALFSVINKVLFKDNQ